MLKHLHLKNFMGLADIALDPGPGINVFTGSSGVGKSTLFKAAYGLCSAGPLLSRHPNWDAKTLEDELTRKFVRLFLPLDDRLFNMHHTGARDVASLTARFANDQEITAVFTENSDKLEITCSEGLRTLSGEPVFIPGKEVLSFMLGFASLYERYSISFDQTYQDMCLLLDHPKIRKEYLSAEVQNAIDEIEKTSQGCFHFYGGGRVTFRTDNGEYSANAVGAGIRTMGMLARLLKTGAIQPGKSGPLFWEASDTNIAPNDIRMLVEILLDLANAGQQIFIETNNYILIKWLEYLSTQNNKVYFYSIYRENKNLHVCKEDEYIKLKNNIIDNEFEDLIDFTVIKYNMLS